MKKLENIASENLVLGKILQDDNAFWTVADVLQPMHFSSKINGEVYSHIHGIMNEGKRLSFQLLASRIGPEYGQNMSTMALLTSLARNAEDVAAGMDGVEDIIENWRKRKLLEEAKRIIQEVEKETTSGTDILADTEVRLADVKTNSQADPLETMGQVVSRVVARSRIAYNNAGTSLPGFDTGLSSLDKILGRMHPGDLGIIGGRSGDAKTALAAQISAHVSNYAPVLYIQLEMTKEAMAERMLAGESDVSTEDIASGSFDMDEWMRIMEAEKLLNPSRFYVDARAKMTMDQIWTRATYARRTKGVKMLVIDHLGLVKNKRITNKFDRVEDTTHESKALAKDLDMLVIDLSQVTRASQRRDDPRPTLNDFDGGSSVEQDADWAIAVWREERWWRTQRPKDMDGTAGLNWVQRNNEIKGHAELINLKRRRGQDGEKRVVRFDGKRQRFYEL